MRIPDGVSFEEAARREVSAFTCEQVLSQMMDLHLPGQEREKRELLIVYGGSTSSGALGIQLATL